MKNETKEELLFPVDKSKADSLSELSKKLEMLAQQNKPSNSDMDKEETISDDFDASPEVITKIQESEQEMRSLLQTMGLDYDALIRMDGKSVYARAVAANPAVLDFVKNSKNPVLEAVKIAVGFKPYAEFMDKYGSEPDEILKNVKEEVEGTKKKEVKVESTDSSTNFKSPSFSNTATGSYKNDKSRSKTLDEIFNK